MENPSSTHSCKSKTRRKEKLKAEERKGAGLRNFRNRQNCLSYATVQIACHCSLFHAAFHFLIFLSPFGLFPICTHCNSTCFDILVILYWVLFIKDPRHDTVKGLFAGSLIKFRREPFSSSHFFSFFFTFLHFLSLSH